MPEERRQNDIDIAVLKEKVAELKAETDKDLKGFFKIFCLTIGAAAVIITSIFAFMCSEIRDIRSSVLSIRQIRQPSPSPRLPVKTYEQGER